MPYSIKSSKESVAAAPATVWRPMVPLSLPLYAPCVPIIISRTRPHRDSIPILPLTLPPLALAFLMRLNVIPRRAHQQQKQWNQRQVNLRAPLMSPKHTAATYGGQRE